MSPGLKRLRAANGAEAVRLSTLDDNAKAATQVRAERAPVAGEHPVSKGCRVIDKRNPVLHGTVKLCDVLYRHARGVTRGHVVQWDKTGAMELVHRSDLNVVSD